MQPQYIGNNDYRGYLNYLGSKGDAGAQTLLGFVGNTGGVNPNIGVLGPAAGGLKMYNQTLYNQWSRRGLAPLTSNPAGGGGGAGMVRAPNYDIAGTHAKARAAAEAAVNPYYVKQMNDFLNRQNALKQARQTQFDTNVKNIEDNLANRLEENRLNRVRTGEDVAQNMSDIAESEDITQMDQGTEFTKARLDAARQTGGGGGLSAQAGEELRDTQNLTEQRQTQAFQKQRNQQALFKSRSMEDLLRSDTLGKTTAEKGKKQEKFDLDEYIKGADYEIEQTRGSLEKARLEEITQKSGSFAKQEFARFIAGLSNPAQILAAQAKYGGSF